MLVPYYKFGKTFREGIPKCINGDTSGIVGNVSLIKGDATGVYGIMTGISGDITNIRGNMSGIYGDVSGISGDVTRYYGNTSRITADVDLCTFTEDEFKRGVTFFYLSQNDINCYITPDKTRPEHDRHKYKK